MNQRLLFLPLLLVLGCAGQVHLPVPEDLATPEFLVWLEGDSTPPDDPLDSLFAALSWEDIYESSLHEPLPGTYPWAELDWLDVPETARPKVERIARYTLRRRSRYLRTLVERGRPYYAYLIQKLTERNLPVELVYLPMIESAYNPFARSRAGAVGLWQFMPSTARKYGLKVNWWVDDRRDPYRSTLAALDYLEALYGEFGRWDLAIAAYNVGEGKIRRALARTRGKTFWDIERRLPRETRAYVPLFLAMYQIFRFYRDSLGIEDPLLVGLKEEPPRFDSVQVPRPTTLDRLARWAGIPLQTFVRLNPRYRRTPTDPKEKNYWIRLPRGHASRFLTAMASDHSPGKWSVYTVHRVRRGETLSHIARRYATSVRTLMRLNRIRNPRRLRPGQRLVVPPPPVRLVRAHTGTRRSGRKRKIGKPTTVSLKPGTYFVYRVRPGDTLYDLSRVFKVPIRTLMRVNGIRSARRLRAGTTLKIPIQIPQGS